MVATSLAAGGTSALAVQVDPDLSAHVEGTSYICQNAARAGEVDLFVVAVTAAAVDGDCRAAMSGELSFTITTTDSDTYNGSTTDEGFVQFDITAPATFALTEDASGVSAGDISVEDNDNVDFLFIQYVESVTLPPGLSGTSAIQIYHLKCLDNARAGETDLFAGEIVQVADVETGCSYGEGTVFLVTLQNVNPTAGDAAGALDWTTFENGLTDYNSVPAGNYIVTEQGNGATSQIFNAPGGSYAFVSVIDYYGVEDGEASVTIHKAKCSTAGADIFGACHDNVVKDIDFSINDEDVTTNADGVASAVVDDGEATIAESEDDFDDELGAYVFCSEQGNGDVLIDGLSETGVVSFEVADGDEVICDWYNLTDEAIAPVDDDGDKDDDVTTLPETGVGATSPHSSELVLFLGLANLFVVAGAFGVRRQRG